MFEWVKALVLRLMRVPHEPEAPLGAPGSARVFRAGLNLYRLRLARWGIGQAGALVGLGVSLIFLGGFGVAVERSDRAFASESAFASPSPNPDGALPAERESRADRRRERERDFRNVIRSYVLPLAGFLEIFGFALFFAQMLVTYSMVRLEFEQHWYIVTDRSLRIRTGILRLQESTMSFANIQQVEIRQGPLQRLLGLADVCVRSAGGGDPEAGGKGHGQEASLHLGVFEGVANAVEIRDLILARLRTFREAGLGDPEDTRSALSVAAAVGSDTSTAEAVSELLTEARALRRALTSASGSDLITSGS